VPGTPRRVTALPAPASAAAIDRSPPLPDLSPLGDAAVADAGRLADTDFTAVSAAADGLDGVAATWLAGYVSGGGR
jgi:hypothetical protein